MDRLSRWYFLLASVGVAVAIYHAYDELTETFTSCNVNQQISCGNVFASGYTSILGVPFYVLGLVWFPLLVVLGLWQTNRGRSQLSGDLLVPVLMIGNAFTIFLWYLELFVIGAVCPVCISLYIINYALTGICLVAFLRAPPDSESNIPALGTG